MKGMGAEGVAAGPRPDEGDRLEVALDELVSAVEQTQMAASTDEARPGLTGVLVQIQGGALTMAATDGHRLAVRKLAATSPADLEASLIVPARARAELSRVLKGEPGEAWDEVERLFDGPLSPGLLRPPGKEHYLYVIMPVRVAMS